MNTRDGDMSLSPILYSLMDCYAIFADVERPRNDRCSFFKLWKCDYQGGRHVEDSNQID